MRKGLRFRVGLWGNKGAKPGGGGVFGLRVESNNNTAWGFKGFLRSI